MQNLAIHWDINLTTIAIFLGGCIAFYMGVIQQRWELTALKTTVETNKAAAAAALADVRKQLEKDIDDVDRRLAEYINAHNALAQSLSAHKEQLAHDLRNFSTWETMREFQNTHRELVHGIEERLSKQIENLGRRLDTIALHGRELHPSHI